MKTDVLSDVLRAVRLTGAIYFDYELSSPWVREAFGDAAIYTGLTYPIAICLLTLLVGGLAIRETKDHRIDTPVR